MTKFFTTESNPTFCLYIADHFETQKLESTLLSKALGSKPRKPKKGEILKNIIKKIIIGSVTYFSLVGVGHAHKCDADFWERFESSCGPDRENCDLDERTGDHIVMSNDTYVFDILIIDGYVLCTTYTWQYDPRFLKYPNSIKPTYLIGD